MKPQLKETLKERKQLSVSLNSVTQVNLYEQINSTIKDPINVQVGLSEREKYSNAELTVQAT